MGKKLELVLNKIKKMAKESLKNWIGFDEWIEELKQNEELNIQIENKLSQNQNMINNTGIESSVYIAVLEDNIRLKKELDDYNKNTKKIKITKSEYKVYKEILKFESGAFYPQNFIFNRDIFAQLRSKEIVKNLKNNIDYFEVIVFEKDLEIVED